VITGQFLPRMTLDGLVLFRTVGFLRTHICGGKGTSTLSQMSISLLTKVIYSVDIGVSFFYIVAGLVVY
jgi:hypothetical protein